MYEKHIRKQPKSNICNIAEFKLYVILRPFPDLAEFVNKLKFV